MKRIVPDINAMKAALEKNKEEYRQRDKVTNEENPLLRVTEPGQYNFRACYYPHTDDPAVTPFPLRSYHFKIPGSGIVYCPQENDGEKCHLCDFTWDRMKEHKGGPLVKVYSAKLPKLRVWIPGKMRLREKEGVKFLTLGSQKKKMSKNHQKMMNWFFKTSTQNWLSHEETPSGGFDMELTYEAYEGEKAAQFGAFGLEGIDLSRDSTPFGGDFDKFWDEIPNIDDNDLPVLSAYTKKTTEDTLKALTKWKENLEKKNSKNTEQTEVRADDPKTEIAVEKPADTSKKKLAAKERLAKLGYDLELSE